MKQDLADCNIEDLSTRQFQPDWSKRLITCTELQNEEKHILQPTKIFGNYYEGHRNATFLWRLRRPDHCRETNHYHPLGQNRNPCKPLPRLRKKGWEVKKSQGVGSPEMAHQKRDEALGYVKRNFCSFIRSHTETSERIQGVLVLLVRIVSRLFASRSSLIWIGSAVSSNNKLGVSRSWWQTFISIFAQNVSTSVDCRRWSDG